MSTIGDRIKNQRERLKMYQSELAKLVGVKSGAVISNWENDINKPDADKLVLLCDALDMSLSYLLDYSGKEEIILSPDEKNSLKKYRALDIHGKDIIDTILDKEYKRCAAAAPANPKACESNPCLTPADSHKDNSSGESEVGE